MWCYNIICLWFWNQVGWVSKSVHVIAKSVYMILRSLYLTLIRLRLHLFMEWCQWNESKSWEWNITLSDVLLSSQWQKTYTFFHIMYSLVHRNLMAKGGWILHVALAHSRLLTRVSPSLIWISHLKWLILVIYEYNQYSKHQCVKLRDCIVYTRYSFI